MSLPERELGHLYSSAEPEPCPSCGEAVSESDPTWRGMLTHLFCAPFADVAAVIEASNDLALVEEAHAIAAGLAEAASREVTKMREMRELRRKLGVCEFCRGSKNVLVSADPVPTFTRCSCSKEAKS